MTYLDPHNPPLLNYSTVQSFPGLELHLVPEAHWTDPTVTTNFEPQLIYQASDLPIEFVRQFELNSPAKFIDPRAVAEPLPDKHDSPRNASRIGMTSFNVTHDSRPLSPAATESPDESQRDTHMLSFNPTPFRFPPVETNTPLFDPAPQTFLGNKLSPNIFMYLPLAFHAQFQGPMHL
jgi:hypothetical protein